MPSVDLVLSRISTQRLQYPIVIFVAFRETAEMLQAEFESRAFANRRDSSPIDRCRSEVFTGDISSHEVMKNQLCRLVHKYAHTCSQERQAIVDDFQNGNLDILICTFGVGSVGITLTRSSSVILLDRPWTPGDALQAEDRIRRIGQTAQRIQSLWLHGFDIDDKLDKLLKKKDSRVHAVLDADSSKIIFATDFSC